MSQFVHYSGIKGLRIPTTVAAAFTAFPTDGSLPTGQNIIRCTNLDPTNSVHVLTGAGGGATVADNTCHAIPPLQSRDLQKRDLDAGISAIAAAGTPVLLVHFGGYK